MDVKSRKAEQSVATRAALLNAARELFTEHGYADAPTEEIVQRAGVTRGALYHHFKDKQDLFRAVMEEVDQEFTQRVALASAGANGEIWERLMAGVDAFLEGCSEPAIRRIILLDAPAVLSLETYREIEAKYGLGLVRGALQGAMDAGVIERQPVEPLAHLVLGVLHEAGMLIATADEPEAARTQVRETVERMLQGLRPAR